MSKQLINQYYRRTDNLRRTGVTNEMSIKQPFDNLVTELSDSKHYVYATEITIRNVSNTKNIRPDGTLMNDLRIHRGYVESKDTNDSLDDEIQKKLYTDGYPNFNIIFQDSIEAVLIQDGEEAMRIEMKDSEKLLEIINHFLEYKPAYIQKFEKALDKFKIDIPIIVDALRQMIEVQNKTNEKYKAARDDFWNMCKEEINPDISSEDIREMVIQHILTEDLFKSVFDESDFHKENNVARELDNLVGTFMTRSVRQNQLSELNHYYRTLNAQASSVADHHEKQKFLKVIYENFYKVYNPNAADKLGVVYTPNEIVDFMIRSTDYLLDKHFGKQLHDENVHILDPATGTGTFVTDIIEYIPAQYLPNKYKHEIHANEVAILPYYVANLNIEFTYKQKMGKYLEFPNICFVDTLDNTTSLSWDRMSIDQAPQDSMFGGFSSENAERIKRQNEQRISVVIGNPPYNANQANFNDFNQNREYDFIDKRIKETFVRQSTAQKTKVYDMYSRFYRWAMDRIDENGVVSFITNRSFIDSRTFDGFRKCIQDDFDYCYVIDTFSDVRANPKIAGTKHNVFGIQTGVAIMFLIRKDVRNESGCQIYYNGDIEDDWFKEKKLEWFHQKKFRDINFSNITPKKNNWINLTDNDWDELKGLVSTDNPIFKEYSLGISTNRDEWVYDFNLKVLKSKTKYFIEDYNTQLIKLKNNSDYVVNDNIKWSSTLEKKSKSFIKLNKANSNYVKSLYRPFLNMNFNFSLELNDRLTNNHIKQFGENGNLENKLICFVKGERLEFCCIASDTPTNMAIFSLDPVQTFPLYIYTPEGERRDNISKWGLEQFQTHYNDDTITREDIFHYTYGVLYDPKYREKYAQNLKREFPRLPFYDNFHQWVDWGKQLMELHINFEEAEPYALTKTNVAVKGDKKKKKLKVKLRAKKDEGIIELDEMTSLSGVPPTAWEYKLGNRSAIEWVLDQYKEKKPRHKTIAEKFNTYRFADYKKQVIDLIQRVTTVSVKTMEIIQEMADVEKY